MEPKTESVAKHPLLVYIVDDESSMGESMRLMAKMHGFEAKVFIHPQWALESLESENEKPVVLLTDFQMLQSTGWNSLHVAKRFSPT